MFKKIINLIVSDPLRIPIHIWSKLYILWLSRKRNIVIKGKIILNGSPLIDIQKGSNLYIGEGVTLNSRNKGYHIKVDPFVKTVFSKS